MSGSTENMAFGAPEKSGRKEILFNLTTAARMLPLVGRIVGDILQAQRRLHQHRPELDQLDRKRHSLLWPERARRYRLQEEIAAAQANLKQVHEELDDLGVSLVDPTAGWIGFPTIVNGRNSFFSWNPQDDSLKFWHFADETTRRVIPPSWAKLDEVAVARK